MNVLRLRVLRLRVELRSGGPIEHLLGRDEHGTGRRVREQLHTRAGCRSSIPLG